MATCSPTGTPVLHGIFLTVGISNSELNTLSTYLQEEVGSHVANITKSMFAAVMDDCVASRIDTHPSVSVPPSKKMEV